MVRYSLKINFIDLEERFEYATSKYTAAEDVLFCWGVIRLFYNVHLVQEVFRAVYELVLVTSFVCGLKQNRNTIQFILI